MHTFSAPGCGTPRQRPAAGAGTRHGGDEDGQTLGGEVGAGLHPPGTLRIQDGRWGEEEELGLRARRLQGYSKFLIPSQIIFTLPAKFVAY